MRHSRTGATLSGIFTEDLIMENLISQLIDSLEQQPDSMPEGYDLEATTYTITVTVLADLAKANLLEAVL